MTQCTSIKSKKNFFLQCTHKCEDNNTLCKKHLRHKNIILFDKKKLNPLNSLNDTDPFSFDKIFYEENGKKILCRNIKSSQLFTYIITLNGKEYQRTLIADTIKNIVEKNLVEPFSQVKFPDEIINDAKAFLAKVKFKKEKVNSKTEIKLNIMKLIDKFSELGYIINYEWLSKLKKTNYITWYNEVSHIWLNLQKDLPLNTILIIYGDTSLPFINHEVPNYINNLYKFFVSFAENNYMAGMILLYALSWASKDVKLAYPDLTYN